MTGRPGRAAVAATCAAAVLWCAGCSSIPTTTSPAAAANLPATAAMTITDSPGPGGTGSGGDLPPTADPGTTIGGVDSTKSPTGASVAGPSSASASQSVDPVRQKLTAAPKPPRLTPTPGDYQSAQAVAAVYLAAWCYQPLNRPANQNIADLAPWVTAAGWADDKSYAVSALDWKTTVAAGLTSVCGPVTATVSAEAPASPHLRWVALSGRRTYVSKAGKIIGQQVIAQTRRVLQGSDGRWLVDVQVRAG